jgi:hypothetical protein
MFVDLLLSVAFGLFDAGLELGDCVYAHGFPFMECSARRCCNDQVKRMKV